MRIKSFVKSEISRIRKFNRFYTRQIGLLDEHMLKSEFSLTELRIMYEIANHKNVTAAQLVSDLGIDAGQLSRTIKSLEVRGVLARETKKDDARKSILTLSETGEADFARLNDATNNQINDLVGNLPS